MKFNFWTLLFQLINFIVLLFILRRILYKPVREIMEKRRGLIEQKVRDAERMENEAKALKSRYDVEMNGLEEQKARLLDKMQREVGEERTKLMTGAREDALSIAARGKAQLQAEKQALEAEIKEHVLESVSIFSSNLMRDVVDETLNEALFRKFIKELERWGPELVQKKGQEETMEVELTAAHPLSDGDLERARESLQRYTAREVTVIGAADPALIAGVRMKAGDDVFDASIAGQIAAVKEKLKETL
jgi:F-type H+-transporting ATPase subunit b